MATIGELAVNVVARTEKFVKGIKRAGKSISTFKKGVGRALAPLKNFSGAIGALGIGISAAGIIGKLSQTAQEIDKLTKSATKLQVTTEQLGALHHAANLNGISIESFNASLQRMNRRISEANQRGTGPTAAALEEVGLRAAELAELNPAEQFERINAAIGSAPSPERIRLAFQFFGREGVDNVRLAGQNLQKYREEAERLGMLYNNGQGAKVENMLDAMTRMGQAFQGVANRIVIDMAPGVAETIEGLLIAYQQIQMEAAEADKARTGTAGSTLFRAINRIPGFTHIGTGRAIANRFISDPARRSELRSFNVPDPGIQARAGLEVTGELKQQTHLQRRTVNVLEQMSRGNVSTNLPLQ